MSSVSLWPLPSPIDARNSLAERRPDALNASVVRIKVSAVGVNESLNGDTTADRAQCIEILIEKTLVVRQPVILTIKQTARCQPHLSEGQL
jgi:hypothetical protein